MWIKFLDSVAGLNFAYRQGQEVDLRVDIAKGFVNAGQARRMSAAETAAATGARVEYAVGAAAETAATRAPGARRRTLKNLGGLLPS